MIWLLAVATLAGCGEPRPQGQTEPPSPAPAATASTSPSEGSASPEDGDGGRADDVNGDGYADLVAEIGDSDRRRIAVVYGSPRGPEPGTRTVVPPETFSTWLLGGGIRGDFDGDGFGDILGYGAPGGQDQQAQGPHLLWGGRKGLVARPTPVLLPGGGARAGSRAVAGDFDGDGNADAVMASAATDGNVASLMVLYGPFTRKGVPARSAVQPSPTGGEFWRLASDKVGGRRATGLIVYEADDGEQTSGRLLTAGPGGLSKTGRELNAGMSAAFGDFDGDGTRDVAVGDDGSRNNEPGYETEPPSVDKTLTVYYGDGRQAAFKGVAGPAVSGDFNGDGRDDVAFGGAGRALGLTAYTAPKVFWGGSGGLGAGREVPGVGEAGPLAAGDYDGDGDDELVFAAGDDDAPTLVITDGEKRLNSIEAAALTS